MAEFQTFNLGQVLQTAEALKGARRQSNLDRLQEQYLGKRIEQADQDIANTNRIQETTLGKEKAQALYTRAQYVLQAQNPKNFVEQNFPEFVKDAQSKGIDWMSLDDNAVKQLAQGIVAKAGAEIGSGPIQAQSVGGSQVITQNGEFKGQVAAARDSTPNSYDEFALAQKDPAFAQFLRERRDKGFSMTLPDGTTFSMGGGVGPGELTKPTVNELQKGAISAQAGIDRLQNIRASFNPKWLSYKEQATQFANSVKAKAQGLPFVSKLTPQEEADLAAFSNFKSDTLDNLNRYIVEITGAAMGVQEAKRITMTMPNLNDDPASFQNKLNRTEERLKLIIARSVYTQKNGMKFDAISVDEMRSLMNERGDEIYQETLQKTGDAQAAKTATIQALQSEFYQ